MKITKHPKYNKLCVFCENWIGNADMELVSHAMGYKFDSDAKGKCTKSNLTRESMRSCIRTQDYKPSREASRIL